MTVQNTSAAQLTTLPPTNTPNLIHIQDTTTGQYKPLKICCACPNTRKPRDECVVTKGEEHCRDVIEQHKQCLRGLGFKV